MFCKPRLENPRQNRYAPPMRRIELDLLDGPGGWVQATVRREGELGVDFYCVRLWQDEEGNWSPQGALYVPGVTPETLRAVPLNRIVLAVNATEALRADLARRLNETAPDVGTKEFWAAFTGFIHDEPPLKLERPKGRRLSDEFFAQVAETYRGAMMRGLPPRTAIAEAAGTSTDVAGRWVREARKRNLLPPTRQGKVRA
jgi:hypothetical protein